MRELIFYEIVSTDTLARGLINLTIINQKIICIDFSVTFTLYNCVINLLNKTSLLI